MQIAEPYYRLPKEVINALHKEVALHPDFFATSIAPRSSLSAMPPETRDKFNLIYANLMRRLKDRRVTKDKLFVSWRYIRAAYVKGRKNVRQIWGMGLAFLNPFLETVPQGRRIGTTQGTDSGKPRERSQSPQDEHVQVVPLDLSLPRCSQARNTSKETSSRIAAHPGPNSSVALSCLEAVRRQRGEPESASLISLAAIMDQPDSSHGREREFSVFSIASILGDDLSEPSMASTPTTHRRKSTRPKKHV